MNKAKDIVFVAICTAMLIGGQLVLAGISGVEVVTVLMLCFCYSFGSARGVAVATTFSLLRCILFGFYIQVIILYLVYYNLFALFFGRLGKRFSHGVSFGKLVAVTLSAMLFTVLFTLLDNVITPLLFGFNQTAATAYLAASLTAVIPQVLCTLITVSIFFVPLTKVLAKIKN